MKMKLENPVYTTVASGADHVQTFRCTCQVGDNIGEGNASKNKGAEENAAYAVLEKLQKGWY